MMGGDLPSNDAWTTSLLTNSEVIAVDQHSTSSHPVITTDKGVVWVSRAVSEDLQYLAIFNLDNVVSKFEYSWKDLGFDTAKTYQLRDLWERRNVGTAKSIAVTVPAHGVVLYGISSAPGNEATFR
jgi:alpha-galactosidase